jgi:hypothetical protein
MKQERKTRYRKKRRKQKKERTEKHNAEISGRKEKEW